MPICCHIILPGYYLLYNIIVLNLSKHWHEACSIMDIRLHRAYGRQEGTTGKKLSAVRMSDLLKKMKYETRELC